MKINLEKNNTEVPIPEPVLNLYKIDGYSEVSYSAYLKSKKVFESQVSNSKINPEHLNLAERIRGEILAQSADSIALYITKALESDDIEVQRIGASLVQSAPEEQRVSLYEVVFEKILERINSPDIQIQRIAINMVQFLPESSRGELREITLEKIMEAFSSSDIEKQRIMAKKIKEAPVEAQGNLRDMVYNLINKALESDDIKTQRTAAVMIQYAPAAKQAALLELANSKFELAKQQHRSNEIVETSLYPKNDKGNDSIFSRKIFPKTGSETTLLMGKQFKNNLIIRHMEEPCFSVWKKAYESYGNWQEAGFDYVPIEPIYSFKYDNKSGSIDAVSGVLDLNLEEWYAFSGDTFKEELDKQKNKILEVLSSLDINHGHANDANFCLRFWRDKGGQVDINKPPRLYLIDFDKAIQDRTKV